MNRIIQSIEERHLLPALDLVDAVFTAHENADEGKLVRALAEEIRTKRFYVPELEIVALDKDTDEVIGHCIFSRIHLEGKYEDRLLLLSPVCVKTALQRQHISKDMIEYGFEKARAMGFDAVIVEGNPRNYNARGFVTSTPHGILPGRTVDYPRTHPECLMVKELREGILGTITGTLEYTDYKVLCGE